jgi:hypothetical protein
MDAYALQPQETELTGQMISKSFAPDEYNQLLIFIHFGLEEINQLEKQFLKFD